MPGCWLWSIMCCSELSVQRCFSAEDWLSAGIICLHLPPAWRKIWSWPTRLPWSYGRWPLPFPIISGHPDRQPLSWSFPLSPYGFSVSVLHMCSSLYCTWACWVSGTPCSSTGSSGSWSLRSITAGTIPSTVLSLFPCYVPRMILHARHTCYYGEKASSPLWKIIRFHPCFRPQKE